MLSDAIWRTKFGADPHIVGRALDFDGGQKTVVGVLPASFDFSTIFTPGSSVDIFECFPLTPETNKWGNTLAIVGRLKPGVSAQSAQAEATVLAKLQEEAHKERNDFDPKDFDADGTRQRQAAAGSVCARDGGRRGDADRVREFVEPAAGAGHDAAKGNCDPGDARSRKDAADPADADGKSDLSFCGAMVGLILAFVWNARAGASDFDQHPVARRSAYRWHRVAIYTADCRCDRARSSDCFPRCKFAACVCTTP